MSIYRSHRDRALDDDLAWEKVLQGGAKTAVDTHTKTPVADDGARLRKANPADYLLPTSINWLKNLPSGLRPVALVTRYPRIVNLLAQHWNDAAACSAYFDDLLIGSRAHRRGFPADVRKYIWELREYFVASRLRPGGPGPAP